MDDYITLSAMLHKYQYGALKTALEKDGDTVNELVRRAVDRAYMERVPEAERRRVDKEIANLQRLREYQEGKLPRFSISSLTENGHTAYFKSERYQTMFDVAVQCAVRDGRLPALDESAFSEVTDIGREFFEHLCGTMDHPELHMLMRADYDGNTFDYSYGFSDKWVRTPLDKTAEAAARIYTELEGTRHNSSMRLIGAHSDMGCVTFPREIDADMENQQEEGPAMAMRQG